MMSTAALTAIRLGNTRAVIEALDSHGEISRARLCEVTALSRTTAHRILRELMAAGAVIERPRAPLGVPGRPERLITLNPDAGVVMGIELGRSQTAVAVLNWAGTVVWAARSRFDGPLDWHSSLNVLLELVDRAPSQLIARGGLRGAMVGLHGLMPSSLNHAGTDDRDRRIADLQSALRSRLGVPLGVASNTRMAAVAEFRARHLADSDLVYCHLSRGVGAAILIGGQLLRGSSNSAGEFGHVRLTDDGPDCHCGSRGCLESVIGVDHVLERARQSHPSLKNFDELCGSTSSDPALRRLAEEIAHTLGRAIGNMCNLINPGHVVLGGELVHLTDDWRELVAAGMDDTSLAQVRQHLQVSLSLHDRQAASHGAGLLALDHVLGRVDILEGETTP